MALLHAQVMLLQLSQNLTGDDSPLQDKDPYDGGKAVVATAPSDDDGGPRGNVILSDYQLMMQMRSSS